MITASPLLAQPARWQMLWREAITDPAELLAMLGLDPADERFAVRTPSNFPLRVPRGFVARMRQGDAHDPLLLQVLPQAREANLMPGFGLDAVGDAASRSAHGVLHKYAGRALLLASGACAVHCRYCFRQHFPYAQDIAAAGQWRAAVDYVRADTSLSEVILSGGDPLSLATPKLEELTRALRSISHVRRLRIHTRLPIVLPARVDDELEAWLRNLAWPCVIVLHVNHANEIDADVAAACARLRACGATLLNQSVLLRDVNDTADALAALSERLLDCGIVPYYLHQLDRVHGTAHFEVPDAAALALLQALRARLPGYLVPRLVREVAGVTHKLPLGQVDPLHVEAGDA